MKKNTPLYNDEINLIPLFKIIWNGKIKILLFIIISLLVGFVYNSQIPENYLNTLTVRESDEFELSKLENIQKLLIMNNNEFILGRYRHSIEQNQLRVKFLEEFINELKDYEEFLFILKKTKKIQEDISKIGIEDQEKKLFKYAKLLEIVKPKNEAVYILNFKWQDPDEANKILQETLNLTSNNLRNKIESENEGALEFIKKFKINQDLERLSYLKEQSNIAKELNIIDNQIDNVNLSQSSVSLRINTADIAYYLRGYKAIDKEIELIQNRDYQSMKFIQDEMNKLDTNNIKLVNYNVYLMQIKSLKDSKLVLLIWSLLGLIVGVFFVFISNAFQSQTASKKNKEF
jgi:LPS O-antigen subunit length determinant protein (WzzB/FepE family)